MDKVWLLITQGFLFCSTTGFSCCLVPELRHSHKEILLDISKNGFPQGIVLSKFILPILWIENNTVAQYKNSISKTKIISGRET